MATERRYMLIGQGARKDKDQTISGEWDFTSRLRFYDSGETDYAEFSHDGTDFTTGFTNTTEWHIDDADVDFRDGGTAHFRVDHSNSLIDILDGYSFRLRDATETDYLNAVHNGSSVVWTHVNTAAWVIQDLTNIQLEDSAAFQMEGGTLRIADSGVTDYGEFYHDGTDFNADFTNTTGWNITGSNLRVDGDVNLGTSAGQGHILRLDGSVARVKGERVASSLADDGTVTFDIVGGLDEGVCIIVTNGSYFDGCVVAHNGISTNLIAGNSSYVSTGNGSNPDVDGDLNIWKPTTTTMSIKNRRGATRAITVYQFGL